MSADTPAHFVAHIGDEFELVQAPGISWMLFEAEGYSEVVDPDTHDGFSLLFRGEYEPVFAQQTVTLRHPALGDRAIFVTPIGRDAEGVTYQAVFN